MLHVYKEINFNECVRLFTDAFRHPPLSYDWLTIEKTERYIRDLTNTPGFLGFLYVIDNTAAALCLGTIDDYFLASQYKIIELAVSPTHHRKGVGSIMLSKIETYLNKKGIEYINLQTSKKIPAYDFYISNDYAAVDDSVNLMKALF